MEELAKPDRVNRGEDGEPQANGQANGIDMLDYVEMSLPELRALDPGKTVFMISVSPIEVHGPSAGWDGCVHLR